MKTFVSYFLKDSAEIFQGLHISGEVIAVYSFEKWDGWFCIFEQVQFSWYLLLFYLYSVIIYIFLCILHMFFIARVALWNKCPKVNASKRYIPQNTLFTPDNYSSLNVWCRHYGHIRYHNLFFQTVWSSFKLNKTIARYRFYDNLSAEYTIVELLFITI